ncbi:MAG: hypothetical protein K6E83_02325 [Clostridium sp.]|nr:hypothetical protein [Clostridium sp.]
MEDSGYSRENQLREPQMYDEIESLRAQVRQQEERIAALERRLMWNAPPQNMPPQAQWAPQNMRPHGQGPWQQAAGKVPKPKRKLSETAVGKYGVGVLASILVLLGVFTGVQIFWGQIPDFLKMLLLVFAGGAISALGYVFTIRTGKQNGFWQSVTATGAAIVFLALAAGALAWNLYGPAVLGLLLFLWFLVCLFASGRLHSRVFYVVSYIGADVALALAMLQIENGREMQAVAGFALLAVVMPAVGIIRQGKERILPWLNYIFLNMTAIFCAREISLWDEKNPAVPAVLMCLQAAAAFAALLEASVLLGSGRAWKKAVRAFAGLIPALLLASAFLQECPEGGEMILPAAAAGFIPALLLGCAALLIIRVIPGGNLEFVPVLAGPAAWCASVILQDVPVLPQCLPAAILFALGMLFISSRGEWEWKLAAYIWYLVMTAAAFYHEYADDWQIALAALILTAEGIWMYFCAARRPIRFRLLEPLVFAVCAPLPLYLFPAQDFTAVDIEEIVPIGASILMLVFYKISRLVPDMRGPREKSRQGELVLAEICAHIFAAMLHLAVYMTTFSLFGSADITLVDKTANPALLLAMSAAGICGAVAGGSMLLAIPAVFSLNCNLVYIAETLTDGDGALLVTSILGIAASAALIGIGFRFGRKNLRILGLITMIIYVLKISVFDLAESAPRGMSVLLLILGGLVCFAISFTYNRLDKLYGEKREKEAAVNGWQGPEGFSGEPGQASGR